MTLYNTRTPVLSQTFFDFCIAGAVNVVEPGEFGGDYGPEEGSRLLIYPVHAEAIIRS